MDKVASVVQYALLVAGRSDEFRDRELGPIHLIKYLYLADLAHAAKNNGATFTGIDWTFFRFGPWNSGLPARIAAAVAALPVQEYRFAYDKDGMEGEGVRWRVATDDKEADALRAKLEQFLPSTVALATAGGVRRFGSDTPELLRHVYNTKPMLKARPNERIDFAFAVPPEAVPVTPATPLTEKQRKKRREAMFESIKRVRDKLEAIRTGRPQSAPALAGPAPRYDEVFFASSAALNASVDSAVPEKFVAEFDDAVWSVRGDEEPLP